MPTKSNITDNTGSIAAIDKPDDETAALVVATRDLKMLDNIIRFFLSDTYGADLNQNIAFSGTPDGVHDGIDKTQYTASAISGTWTFNLANTHAKDATVTIVDYTGVGGDTVTVTIDGSATVLTEGADWNAGASNAAAATSLASAIHALSGVTASATAAVVTAIADTDSDITALATNAGADITVSARSIDATATVNDNVAQLARGSAVDLTNYTAITGWIYITGWQAVGVKDVELIGWDTGAAAVGDPVLLSSYVDTMIFDTWHSFSIDLDDMSLTGKTIDAFRIRTISTGGGLVPDYYLDYIQIQQAGAPEEFSVKPDNGTWLHIKEANILIVDAYTGITTVGGNTENATLPNLSYNKILGLTRLSGGIIFRQWKEGAPFFTYVVQDLSDFFMLPGTRITSSGSDGTNSFIVLNVKFAEPVVLKAEDEDKLSLTVTDDLSGLLLFRVSVGAGIEAR